jgi:heterodisulfide reductase subunit A-like polyferredoxin
MDAGRHPLIEVLTNTEVSACEGEVGDFKVTLRRNPRFVDEEACVACGECSTVCPVEVRDQEFDSKMTPRKAIYRPFPQSVPAAFLIDHPNEAPCKLTCPVGQDVPGYLALVTTGKTKEALALIRSTNPLPGVCGRVCYHPCEDQCRRAFVDDPLAVKSIKRFVTENTPVSEDLLVQGKPTGRRVAVVGSGPAGLAAAHELALCGHGVVVFERAGELGGMLRLGIPAFRLPRTVLDADIEVIRNLGVDFRVNEEIDVDSLQQIQDEFDAVFLATGAHRSIALDTPGSDVEGVWAGIEFLRSVNLRQSTKIGQRVAVIGGGNTAVDTARTAVRLGAKTVCMYYRRSRSEMPADEQELLALGEEGIDIEFLVAPTKVLSQDGRVSGIEMQKMELGERGPDGRRQPFPIDGSEFTESVDTVILAIGQKPETELLKASGLTLTRWDTVTADDTLRQTNIDRIFAGGDVVRGPSSVVEAMSDGQRAARAIDNLLSGRPLDEGLEPPSDAPQPLTDEERLTLTITTESRRRAVMPELDSRDRLSGFEEVELGFTEAMAREEAARCLNCGVCSGCRECTAVCEVGAIDLATGPIEIERSVGAILVAVGFKEFDAELLGNYGYGRYPDVITSLELERMLNASGPTGGHVVRPSDRQTPKRIVFVQCAGARGEGGRNYCSRFCCMNAVKDSMLVRQHDPEIEEVTILYTDLRAFGKGFDDFLQRSRDEGSAVYLRGRPAKIDASDGGTALEIFVEDTLAHEQQRLQADLVVLSIAAAPNEGAIRLAERLAIETDDYGFIARRDPAISAIETSKDGIFVCGSAVGPQVIPDCVAQASATAARAQSVLSEARVEEVKKPVDQIDLSGPPRIGVMVCHCGANIAGVLDVEDLAVEATDLPDVELAVTNLFTCSSTGQDELVELIREHQLNRVVVAACTPRTHEPVFRETCERVGLNPYMFEMVNIRDQCSWVHAGSRIAAQEKARSLIRMGVARGRHLEPLQAGEVPMTRAALVIGGGIAGIQAATDIAAQGFPVTLVEKDNRLGGRLNTPHLKHLYPNFRLATDVLAEKISRLESSGVRVLLETEVENISGFVGNFEITLRDGTAETLTAGAIVLATGADLYDPKGEYRYGELPNVITSEELESMFCSDDGLLKIDGHPPQSAAFVLCVGSRDPSGFSGCSRYCCPTAVKQALQLSSVGIDTTVFYRDIRTISTGAEEMYRAARGKGVLFVRVPPGETPTVEGADRARAIRCFDDLMGRNLEVPADLVVLSVGMRPRQPETARFHELLKVSLGLDGFFLERHPELAPVETAVEGVLLAGTVQGPKDFVDSVAQASAAAAKASVFLAYDSVRLDPAISVVDQDRCRGCGDCVEICQFHAPQLTEIRPELWVSSINPSLCKGCGTCSSWCPSGAITSKHFTDDQVHAMIDAALT